MSNLDSIRRYYAEELRAAANLQSEALVQAFAKVIETAELEDRVRKLEEAIDK